jgi:hypothetical protein
MCTACTYMSRRRERKAGKASGGELPSLSQKKTTRPHAPLLVRAPPICVGAPRSEDLRGHVLGTCVINNRFFHFCFPRRRRRRRGRAAGRRKGFFEERCKRAKSNNGAVDLRRLPLQKRRNAPQRPSPHTPIGEPGPFRIDPKAWTANNHTRRIEKDFGEKGLPREKQKTNRI